MRSMPLGKDGKMPSGLLIFLLKYSQKHLGQSFNKLKLDGENLYGILPRIADWVYMVFGLRRKSSYNYLFANIYVWKKYVMRTFLPIAFSILHWTFARKTYKS